MGSCTPYRFGVQPPAQFLLGCSVLCKAPAEIYGALQRARTEAAGAEHALGHPRTAFSLWVSWLALQNHPCTTPQARGSAAGDKSPLPIPTCLLQQRGACQEIPLAQTGQRTRTPPPCNFLGGGRSCLHPQALLRWSREQKAPQDREWDKGDEIFNFFYFRGRAPLCFGGALEGVFLFYPAPSPISLQQPRRRSSPAATRRSASSSTSSPATTDGRGRCPTPPTWSS